MPNLQLPTLILTVSFLVPVVTIAADPLLVPVSGAPGDKLNFDSSKALEYLKKYCKEGNDCSDGEFKEPNGTDCTHFVCHALMAGGITVANIEAHCKSKCCIRVKELAAAFYNATNKYSNVKQVELSDAREGDVVFRVRYFVGKSHVMVLAGKPDEKGAKVYGHANSSVEVLAMPIVTRLTACGLEHSLQARHPLDEAWTEQSARWLATWQRLSLVKFGQCIMLPPPRLRRQNHPSHSADRNLGTITFKELPSTRPDPCRIAGLARAAVGSGRFAWRFTIGVAYARTIRLAGGWIVRITC